MKLSLRLLLVTSAGVLAARTIIGCATDDSEPDTGTPTPDGAAIETSTLDAGGDGPLGDAKPDAPPVTCSQDDWCYTGLPDASTYDASALPPNIPGTTFGLRAVWVAPNSHAWAVSKAGHVLHWDGTSWRVETIAAQPLATVWGWGTNDVWVAGERGLVLHGTITAGVITFAPVTIGTTQTIAKIAGTSATDVWAIADGLDGSGTLNRVFRLDAAGAALLPTTVPSPFTDSTGKLKLSVLWTAGTDVWVAGYATTCGGPGPCKFKDELVALKWNGTADAGADAGAAWTYVPLLRDYSELIPAATSTKDGVQLLAFRGINYDDGFVARIASDTSKLDGGPEGGISQEGAYAWTQELAESYGSPTGIWANTRNDALIIGLGGVVRHYDGTAWQLVRLSLSRVTPLLANLYAVHGITTSAGEQHIWIVGDDVALQRTVKP